jgi:glycosyltransferase involved in cell wall biosynthesis
MMTTVDRAADGLVPLRIGFDGRALVSPAGGMRRYAHELFGALSRIDGLTVIAVGAPPAAAVPGGVGRTGAGVSLPTNAGWMLSGLPLAARRAHLDLFHAPSYTAPVGGPRPLVLTIHDVSYARHPEWYPYRRDPLRRALYRHSARSADRIVTDSEFSKQEIIAAYGIAPETIAVVPLAPAPVFQPGPRLPLPARFTGPLVLHVGDLHPRRNLPMLVHAVAAVRRRAPALRDLTLVLVGIDRGSGETLRAAAASTPGERPLIDLVAAAPDEELLALYRSAAALVYPSRYEGFGLPLLEAMACGTPVVAARTSSIPEVTGDAAVLLDPDDGEGWSVEIERVCTDESHAARLREAGLRRAALFSWRRTAEETARVYRSLLTRSS